MDKILSKLRLAVSSRQLNDAVAQDVRRTTLTFRSYKWVLICTALVAFYYAFIATDRYVSEARVYVKSTDSSVGAITQLQLLGGGGVGDGRDAALVSAYLHSNDLVERMERELAVSKHYSESGADFFSALSVRANAEERLKYFKSRVTVTSNAESGLLVIRAQGFTPEFSLQLVQAIIRAGEEFINGVGQKIAREEIAFVELELNRAKESLEGARDQLLKFQNTHKILSAEATGASMQEIVSQLEGELARLQTDANVLAGYLNEGASELVVARSKVAAVENQLAQERSRLANQSGGAINDLSAQYAALEMDMKFATDLYKASLIAFERARVESYHKLKHLVVIQAPTMPDSASYPRKLYNLLTFFIALSLAYGVITMILATIREHRDV